MAIGAFPFFKAAGERASPLLLRLFSIASQSSFGVYLIHPIILVWMSAGWAALGFPITAGPSIIVIPFVALVAFLISWGVTFVMRRIPIVRIAVP